MYDNYKQNFVMYISVIIYINKTQIINLYVTLLLNNL